MRVRSVVLPAVLAVAAAVLAPTSAQAATRCALHVPTRVVVDSADEETVLWMGGSCSAADVALWDFQHGDDVYEAYFFPEDFDEGVIATSIEWRPEDPMGRWKLVPQGAATADGTPLDQNSAVTTVKYGSWLTSRATRSGSKLSWEVTATQWSGRRQMGVARPHASVSLLHRAPGSTAWTYVKSVTTSSTGRATVSLAAPKAGSYRLKVAETPTVWASYSPIVQGRR